MKKFLLLLFIASVGYSQKTTRLTAYMLVNPHDDGPCSIKSYVNYQDAGEYFFTYVSAESQDQSLINRLLAIKKQSKRWKQSGFSCSERMIGGDPIPHMFVIEKADGNDTIYTNYDHTYIIVPEKEKAFHDKDSLFLKTLSGNIKEFFDYDFDKSLRSMFVPENDSIADTSVTYRGTRAHSYMMESFIESPEPFRLVSRDSLYNDIKWIYQKGKDTVSYYEGDVEANLHERESEFNAAGIKPGDSEKVLIERFPRSTRVQQYYHVRFEDIKRMYFYVVEFESGKGALQFFIKDGIIDYICIFFYKAD